MIPKIQSFCALIFVCSSVWVHAVEFSEKQGNLTIGNAQFSLSYDLGSGTYSAENLATKVKVFSGARFTVDEMDWKKPDGVDRKWITEDVEDGFGKGRKLSIEEAPKGGYQPIKTLHITVYDKQSFAVLGFSVTNQRKIPMRVCRVGLIDQAAFLPKRDVQEVRVLQGGAGAEKNRVQDHLEITAFNNLLVTGKIDAKRMSIVVGGFRYHEFYRQIRLDEKKRQLSVTVEDPQGKRIEPGTTYVADDTVFLDFTTVDPFASLERYGLAMRDANQAHPKVYNFPTLCGWMVSSSYGEGRHINDSKELVGQMELAKASGILKYTKVGIRLEPDYYCQQDNGNTQQGWWDDEHWAKYKSLVAPYETFGKFCGKIRELGGIPFTYIQTNMPSNDFAMAHPEWMLNNDISRLHAEHRHHMPFVKYDFTDPGFQAHTLAMWKRMRENGLLGIKFDYPESGWCKDGGFEDPTHTTTTAYRKIFELARAGLSEEAFIHERNLGEYGTPCLDVTAGIIDLQRVWLDSSHFEPEMASRIGLRWYKNRSVFGYYPDGKSFKNMGVDARRSMLSEVGLISGRVELGTSFGRMTPDEMHDLTRLYPIFGGLQSFRPVDMLVGGKSDPAVYAYRVNDEWTQLLLCNNFDRESVIKVPLSGDQSDTGSLALDKDGSYYIHDFWNDQFLGAFQGDKTFEVKLKPYQALTYSVHRKSKTPQFVSTNRHIMQGMVDLAEVKWDESTKTYSGVAKVVAGEPFVITLANNGQQAAEVQTSAGKGRLESVGEPITRLILTHDANADVKWSITWKAGSR